MGVLERGNKRARISGSFFGAFYGPREATCCLICLLPIKLVPIASGAGRSAVYRGNLRANRGKGVRRAKSWLLLPITPIYGIGSCRDVGLRLVIEEISVLNWEYTPFAFLMMVGGIASLVISAFAWHRRLAVGAKALALVALSLAVWSLSDAVALGYTQLPPKLFWTRMEYLGIVGAPVFWYILALQYSSSGRKPTRRQMLALGILPLVTTVLVWTNDFHGLMRHNVSLARIGPYYAIAKTYGVWFWVHTAYSYVMMLAGAFLLIRTALSSPQVYRGQALSLVVAALLPWVANVLYVLRQGSVLRMDMTPMAFTLSCIGVAWGLFRFGLLDIVPAARDTVIENMTDGVMVLGAQGHIVDINPAAQDVLNCRASEVIGQPFSEVTTIAANLIGRYRDAASVHTEVTLQQAGEPRSFDLRISPLYDSNRRYVGRLIVFRDITERKLASQRIQESLAQLSTLVDSLQMGVLVEDDTGRILQVNRQFGTMLALPGYSQDLRGTDYGQVVAEIKKLLMAPDAFEQQIEKPVALGKQVVGKEIALTDGRILECDGIPILVGEQRKGHLWLWRNVTERKRFEAQVHEVQKMEAIGRLAGGVAHDFNNLLTVMNGYSQFLWESLTPEDPLREDVEQIRLAGAQAAVLTRQLLAFSRRQTLEMRVLNVNEILDGLVKMLARLIGEDITIEMKLAEDLGYVRADIGQMEQVLVNLVTNARDAMPSGGTLTIETANVELDASYSTDHFEAERGQYVLLAVRDTGHGLSPDAREHLFEPFFTTKPEGEGTGLGLAMVYGIIKQSGGSIEIPSVPEGGTTVNIYLPIVDEMPEETGDSFSETSPPKGAETILVVEDRDDVRRVTANMLRRLGYTVLEKPSGAAAIDLLRTIREPVDLVLTDVIMPAMDGVEMMARACQTRQCLKVLYMSGYTDERIVDHGALEAGASVIYKPFTIEAIAARVREVLDED